MPQSDKNTIHRLLSQRPAWLLLPALLVTFLLYLPGIHGPFMFDDYPNLVNNDLVHIQDLSLDNLTQAAFASPTSNLGRPVASLSFGINHVFSALAPLPYKLTNLFIHLLTGVLAFLTLRRLLSTAQEVGTVGLTQAEIQAVALIATSLWLIHPINVSPALYVVQRMTSLSALFVLIALLTYLIGRQQQIRGTHSGWPWIIGSIVLLAPLATLSKENGILIPGYLWVIEFFLLRFQSQRPAYRRYLKLGFLLVLALPIALFFVYLTIKPDFLLEPYKLKPFSLAERLMTEGRVFWVYIKMLLLPTLQDFTLYHDDVPVSHTLFQPWTTLPAIIAFFSVLALTFLARSRYPILSFGIAFFVIGHSLESSLFALELMQEHRNYLPSIGLFFLLASGISRLIFTPHWHKTGLLLSLGFVLIFAFTTALRSDAWSSPDTSAIEEAVNHPESSRSQLRAGVLYGKYFLINRAIDKAEPLPDDAYKTFLAKARHYLDKAAQLDTTAAIPVTSLILLDSNRDKPVPAALISELKHRLSNPAKTHVDHASALASLADAAHRGSNRLSNTLIEELFQSALNNLGRPARQQAIIYSRYARFRAKNMHDHQGAAAATRHAMKLDPTEIRHTINLITILIATQQWQAASEQLAKARLQDRFHSQARNLKLLEQAIQKHAKPKQSG